MLTKNEFMPHIGIKIAKNVYRLWINLTKPSLSVPEEKSSAHKNVFIVQQCEKITLRFRVVLFFVYMVVLF